MKYLLIILCIGILSLTGVVIAKAQKKYKLDGDTIRSIKAFEKKEVIKTSIPYKDTKGDVFDIYISSTGSAFYYKTSPKTGKQYKVYLGEDMSKQVCAKLGRAYIPNNRKHKE